MLRLGKDDEGWSLAQSVHLGRLRRHQLQPRPLHDQMTKFRTLTNDHFIVEMSAHEAELYGDRVLGLLGCARETLTRKYGVELTEQARVEGYSRSKRLRRPHLWTARPRLSWRLLRLRHHRQQPAAKFVRPIGESVLWHGVLSRHHIDHDKKRDAPRLAQKGISVLRKRRANPRLGRIGDSNIATLILPTH